MEVVGDAHEEAVHVCEHDEQLVARHEAARRTRAAVRVAPRRLGDGEAHQTLRAVVVVVAAVTQPDPAALKKSSAEPSILASVGLSSTTQRPRTLLDILAIRTTLCRQIYLNDDVVVGKVGFVKIWRGHRAVDIVSERVLKESAIRIHLKRNTARKPHFVHIDNMLTVERRCAPCCRCTGRAQSSRRGPRGRTSGWRG